MDFINNNILLAAIVTAFGSAVGASMYKILSKSVKKRDDKVLEKLETLQNLMNIFLRYNLQEVDVLDTILDALKTNHINGNIERADEHLQVAKTDLQSGIQNELLKNAK